MNHYTIIRLTVAILVAWPLSTLSAPDGQSSVSGFRLSAPLDRNELIQAVIAVNPGMEALQAAENAAVARIEPAGALDDPMLSTSVAPLQFGGGGEIDRSYNLELSQSLPWPGRPSACRKQHSTRSYRICSGPGSTTAPPYPSPPRVCCIQ